MTSVIADAALTFLLGTLVWMQFGDIGLPLAIAGTIGLAAMWGSRWLAKRNGKC